MKKHVKTSDFYMLFRDTKVYKRSCHLQELLPAGHYAESGKWQIKLSLVFYLLQSQA